MRLRGAGRNRGVEPQLVPVDLDPLQVVGEVGQRARISPRVRVDQRCRSRSDAGPWPSTNRRVSSRRASSPARSSDGRGRHRLVDEDVGVLRAARRAGADDRAQLGDEQQVADLLPGCRRPRQRRKPPRSPCAPRRFGPASSDSSTAGAAAVVCVVEPQPPVAGPHRPLDLGAVARCIQRRSSGPQEVPRRAQHVGAHPAAGRLLGEQLGIRRAGRIRMAERPGRQRGVLGLHARRAAPRRPRPCRRPAVVSRWVARRRRCTSRRRWEARHIVALGHRRSAERPHPRPHRPTRHTRRPNGRHARPSRHTW